MGASAYKAVYNYDCYFGLNCVQMTLFMEKDDKNYFVIYYGEEEAYYRYLNAVYRLIETVSMDKNWIRMVKKQLLK